MHTQKLLVLIFLGLSLPAAAYRVSLDGVPIDDLASIEEFGFIYFDDTHVVRHPLVQTIIKAYEVFQNGSS